ncbi:hypothetical protein NLG97_g4657 [Lecanicillium saksenae]|uniref:Uncharacterized protein n=1 Tax=Lecanicillium saksenae TaxID=468837 RepID=A0ACC1QXU3_9HYPO|nr:hypothetical protein NLG97_g4657 [Lecanicillium saksenae]
MAAFVIHCSASREPGSFPNLEENQDCENDVNSYPDGLSLDPGFVFAQNIDLGQTSSLQGRLRETIEGEATPCKSSSVFSRSLKSMHTILPTERDNPS